VAGFVILSATKDLAGKMIRFFASLRMTKKRDTEQIICGRQRFAGLTHGSFAARAGGATRPTVTPPTRRGMTFGVQS